MSKRGQKGFTLIELMAALGVSAIIIPVVVSSIFQISRGTATVNRDFVIQLDIDRAASFFSRDLSEAQTTDLDCVTQASSMRVDWLDKTEAWGLGQSHYARYYKDGALLKREYDDPTNIVIAARNVASITFSRSGNFITVRITSSLGGASQTLSYFVTPRTEGVLSC